MSKATTKFAIAFAFKELLLEKSVDKKPIDELPLSLKEKVVLKKVIKAVEGTDLEILLKESGLLR